MTTSDVLYFVFCTPTENLPMASLRTLSPRNNTLSFKLTFLTKDASLQESSLKATETCHFCFSSEIRAKVRTLAQPGEFHKEILKRQKINKSKLLQSKFLIQIDPSRSESLEASQKSFHVS